MKNKTLEDKKSNTIPSDDYEEDIDLNSEGPSISSMKKSKMLIILASSLLVTLVIYFFFVKGDNKAPEENLEEVAVPEKATVAKSDNGKSAFEFSDYVDLDSDKKDTEILEKPAVPEIPTLPTLPDKGAGILPLIIGDENKDKEKDEDKDKEGKKDDEKNQDTKVVNATDDKSAVPIDPKLNNPRYSPIIVLAGEAGPTRSVGYEENIVNLRQDSISKLAITANEVVPTYIKDRSHSIIQGKLINAVLETAINTEVPGVVRGIVSRDVYAESGNKVLIPRGSRLYGSYSSQILHGQGRVEISWNRLIRPDGVDLNISFKASDQFGRSGIEGDVDNRYGTILVSSLLTSILAVAGVAAAEGLLSDKSTTTTTTATDGSNAVIGNASSKAIYDVGKSIIDSASKVTGSAVDLPPVIRVPQGTRITVIVNDDMTLPDIREVYSGGI